jgi:homeobox protein cut-like
MYLITMIIHLVTDLCPISHSQGQMIISSRGARTAALIYFMILHLLVFMVLYRLAYTETCHRDMAAECAQK